MRYVSHEAETFAAFLPDELADADRPRGHARLLPLRIWRQALATLPDRGPVEPGDPLDSDGAMQDCLAALRAEGPAIGFGGFAIERDPAIQQAEWYAQICRQYLDNAADIASAVRQCTAPDAHPLIPEMAARAMLAGVTVPGAMRVSRAKERAEERERAAQAAKAAREYRAFLAKPCTWTPSVMGELGGKQVPPCVAVAVDELVASPSDPVAKGYLVEHWQGLKPTEYRLRDGKRVLFFSRESFTLGAITPFEIARGVNVLPSDYPFTGAEAERREVCKTVGQRLPDDIARHIRAQRAKQIDPRPMTDAETSDNGAVVEQWLEFIAPHLGMILPLGMATGSHNPNGFTARHLYDWGIRGLKIDVVTAHDALIKRLHTFVRCSGRKIEHYRPNTWDQVSVMVARELESSFAGGPRTVVNPGEVEGPGLAARAGASIRGLFSRKPKPIPAAPVPAETETEMHMRTGAAARRDALARIDREIALRDARHQREVEMVEAAMREAAAPDLDALEGDPE